MVIQASEMFLRMDLLGMKPVYCGLMMLLLIMLRQLERVVAISLYMIVSMVRDLQSLRCVLSAFFGITFMTPIVMLWAAHSRTSSV